MRRAVMALALVVACTGREEPTRPAEVGNSVTAAATWTFCADAGFNCAFTGRRDVRFGGATGPYAQTVAYANFPCASSSFPIDPAPGVPEHCDYADEYTQSLVNPRPMAGSLGTPVTAPLGDFGADTNRIRPTTDVPVAADGAFRTTCTMATAAFDDPIAYPNQPNASHLHVFFGHVGVNASSTPASLRAAGKSTCRGGAINRTAYWIPALYDTLTNRVVTPDEGIIYYKNAYNVDPLKTQTLPAGLVMIAGDGNATAAQPEINWGCRDLYTESATIPVNRCPVGDAVRLFVQFPQCWDGVRLDSQDHKAHMAFIVGQNPPLRSYCPATHPVQLPAISELFDWQVKTLAAPSAWRLSSDVPGRAAGLTAHADWMGAWDPSIFQIIVTRCLRAAMDCGVASIGDGRELF